MTRHCMESYLSQELLTCLMNIWREAVTVGAKPVARYLHCARRTIISTKWCLTMASLGILRLDLTP